MTRYPGTKYLRYGIPVTMQVVSIIAFARGGLWMWGGYLIGLIVVIGGDSLLDDDLSEPEYAHGWLLDAALYSMGALMLVAMMVVAWMCGNGGDWLGLGAFVQSLFGWDMQAARAQTGAFDLLGAAMSIGLMFVTGGTNVAHELTHRTRSKLAVAVGRWLLAMTCDASFSIEHVYNHHAKVATPKDPATARRGENAWAFVVRSTVRQSLSAWRIEKRRLTQRGIAVWSLRSRMPRGIAMSAVYFALFYAAAGWTGVLVFLGAVLWGRSLLEFVNYIEHYGLVRADGAPVGPRHSWNSNKPASAIVLFNLTRHSHHHAEADLPFWKLKPYAGAPTLRHGYLTSIFVAMIPPLWLRLMTPKLKHWDENYATPVEYQLAVAANRASGLPQLMRMHSSPVVQGSA